MCKPNNQPKTLTKKDFYDAFFTSEIKDSQSSATIRELMYGDAMEIAAEVAYKLYCEAVGIKENEFAQTDFICLSKRQNEFTEALLRGFDDDLKVYEGWDIDSYFIVNPTKKSEYKIEFKTVNGKALARCECRDYSKNFHICKHIAQKLVQQMYGRAPLKREAINQYNSQNISYTGA